MLQFFALRRLASLERQLQLPGSMDYLRYLAASAPRAFRKFALFLPLAAHRRRLPTEVVTAVRVAGTMHQDCGTCVEVVLVQARQEGVPAALLEALVAGRAEAMPADVALAYRFARAVCEQTAEADELREQVRTRFGDEGLAELALAVASVQVFPITKRALGFAQSCSATFGPGSAAAQESR